MKSHQQTLLKEYARFRSHFNFHLLGLLEIGSQARGEAVSVSDRDIRIVIQSPKPFVLLQEHAWTDIPDIEVTYLDWADLNTIEDVPFGITNIAFVEQCIQFGQYPLNDHTCIYQGQILVEDEGTVQRFRDKYAGVMFANILGNYLRQTEWRVNHKLRTESEFTDLERRLDQRKIAIPVVHTCCRIVRDIAQIDTYRQQTCYLADFAALEVYYQSHWPGFYPFFRRLFAYKIDEEQRRMLFEKVRRRDAASQLILSQLQDRTVELWKCFKESVIPS